MFGKSTNTVSEKELQREIELLEGVVEDKDQEIKDLKAANLQISKEYESKERILRNELLMEIDKATALEKQNTQNVKEENSVLKKEVAILNKAFENMGFDVKDMKEILNKLVDGVVAKNEIKLVK